MIDTNGLIAIFSAIFAKALPMTVERKCPIEKGLAILERKIQDDRSHLCWRSTILLLVAQNLRNTCCVTFVDQEKY